MNINWDWKLDPPDDEEEDDEMEYEETDLRLHIMLEDEIFGE